MLLGCASKHVGVQQCSAADELPGAVKAYNNLGVLQRDVGAMKDALAAYDKCLELTPDSRNAGKQLHNQRASMALVLPVCPAGQHLAMPQPRCRQQAARPACDSRLYVNKHQKEPFRMTDGMLMLTMRSLAATTAGARSA